MFLNNYHHSFDEKFRLTIPAKFREISGGAFVVKGLDRNLMVLPPAVFQVLLDHLAEMSITDPKVRQLRQSILGYADKVIPDANNRILIQQNLRDLAGLKRELVLVGMGDYFEIWSEELWQKQEERINDDQTNEDRYAAIDLTLR